MNIKNILSLFIIVILADYQPVSAQSILVTGSVKDAQSGEALPGVTLHFNDGHRGCVTDNFGQFSHYNGADTVRIQASYMGYQQLDTQILAHTAIAVTLFLQPVSLGTVEIVASKGRTLSPQTIQIPVSRLKAIPMLMGQPDLLKALAFLPGVTNGVEGTTGLYVRGGTPDQNLILLDGATVYNAAHLFGFQSVFDPNAIKDIKLIKGGFPAKYGGRLSSVIDITMKEGNNQRKNRAFTLGMINSGIMLEGPVRKNKSSYMVSGRAAYPGLLLLPGWFASRKKDDKPFNTILSSDFNFKYNTIVGTKGQLFASFYIGDDRLISQYRNNGFNYSTDLGWGNRTGAVRYLHRISEKIYSTSLINATWYYLREKYTQREESEATAVYYLRQSSIREGSVKQQFSAHLAPGILATAGLEWCQYRFQPTNISFTSDDYDPDSLATRTETFLPRSVSGFMDNNIRILPGLTLNAGVRYSMFYSGRYRYWEPRISAVQEWQHWSVNIAYAHTVQFIHLLANNALGLTSDLWVPSTDKIAPQVADQYNMEVLFHYPDQGWEGSVGAFYKQLNEQIDYRQGINFLSPANLDWQNTVVTGGEGLARGIELMLKKETPVWSAWLSYTISKNERRFEDINKGQWYPFRYDRRHSLTITSDYHLGKQWKFGCNFIYQSGSRLTLPQALMSSYNYNQPGEPSYNIAIVSGRNNQKLPAYHRMDVSFTKSFLTRKKERPATLALGVYNLYGRKNPYVLNLGARYSGDTQQYRLQVSSRALFSVLPFIAYTRSL